MINGGDDHGGNGGGGGGSGSGGAGVEEELRPAPIGGGEEGGDGGGVGGGGGDGDGWRDDGSGGSDSGGGDGGGGGGSDGSGGAGDDRHMQYGSIVRPYPLLPPIPMVILREGMERTTTAHATAFEGSRVRGFGVRGSIPAGLTHMGSSALGVR